MYDLEKEKIDNLEEASEKEVNASEEEINREGVEEVSSEDENIDAEPAFIIKNLENKVLEQEEALKRINAEYANYRRRTMEEKASIGLYANEKIVSGLIPVIDNLERALDSFENKEDNLYVGVEMVYKQLIETLKNAGVEEIKAEIGSDFDHNMHMAVIQEESQEYDSGKILMVLQKGYMLGKKVLRATMVKVSN